MLETVKTYDEIVAAPDEEETAELQETGRRGSSRESQEGKPKKRPGKKLRRKKQPRLQWKPQRRKQQVEAEKAQDEAEKADRLKQKSLG